jgi:hypothetical protein
MKQEELFKTLIKELFALDTTHQEYQDNDTHFVVDSRKNGNTLTIKVELLENKDKKEFEQWLQGIDDALFSEVLDELREKEGLVDLDEIYKSKDYKKVINRVKSKTKEVAARKIKELQKLIV